MNTTSFSALGDQISPSAPGHDTAKALAKAVLSAAEQLSLSPDDLSNVLGISRSDMARLKAGLIINPQSEPGALALLLIRAADALSTLSAGNPGWITHFMRSPNTLTGGIPAQQIQSADGLVRVVELLEALRLRS